MDIEFLVLRVWYNSVTYYSKIIRPRSLKVLWFIFFIPFFIFLIFYSYIIFNSVLFFNVVLQFDIIFFIFYLIILLIEFFVLFKFLLVFGSVFKKKKLKRFVIKKIKLKY